MVIGAICFYSYCQHRRKAFYIASLLALLKHVSLFAIVLMTIRPMCGDDIHILYYMLQWWRTFFKFNYKNLQFKFEKLSL